MTELWGVLDSWQIVRVHSNPCLVAADFWDVQRVLGYVFHPLETTHFLFVPASAFGTPHIGEIGCCYTSSVGVPKLRLSDRILPECRVASVSSLRGPSRWTLGYQRVAFD